MRLRPGRRHNPRIGDEVRFHRDRLIEHHVARGVDRQEAERRAFIEFGNVLVLEEDCRDVRGRWLEDLAQDLRYALRALRRNPIFAAVAVVSLALGIGANTAIFSLINGVMLRPLPVHQPDRLVQIARIRQDAGQQGRLAFVSYPVFEHLRDQMKSVDGLFAQFGLAQSIAIDGEEDFVSVDAVSGSYFGVLGLAPAAGRFFGAADDVLSPGAAAAVITHGYWLRRFGGRADAVGRSIVIRQRRFTILGVAPRGYTSAQSGRAADLIVPLLTMLTENQRTSVGNYFLPVLGRLKPGNSVAQANAEVAALFARLLQTNAQSIPARLRAEILRQRVGADAAPWGFNFVRDAVARPLLIVMGIVGLILLLACVNISGLLLARAEARHREVSVRLAIGAGRARLARQFLTETLVLALLGGGLGFALAQWFSVSLLNLVVSGGEVVLSAAPDWRVLAFTVLASLVTCIAAGVVPALGALRVNVTPGLKEVRTRGQSRIGRVLVTAQLAISMVLVVGATLFVGTLVKLYAVDRGFQSDGVLVINVRHAGPYSRERAIGIQRELVDALRTLPGAGAVSAAQTLPVGGAFAPVGALLDHSVQVEGHAARPDEPNVGVNVIAPGFFATLGTPVVDGREFTDGDTSTAPRVAIVNESFARYFFGRSLALGRRFTSVGTTYEIVGVVGDTKYRGLREPMARTIYIPWTQREERDQPSSYSYLVQITEGDPLRLVPDVERTVHDADPGLHVHKVASYASIINRSISNERVMATLAGLFGTLGLLIAAVGMFGVLAFQVGRRTNELAVRMVLGADRSSVVFRDIAAMLVPGVAIGAAGALMLTGLAGGLLFGLTPDDPRAFATAAAVLTCAVFIAGWLPARRASLVDPMAALRHE